MKCSFVCLPVTLSPFFVSCLGFLKYSCRCPNTLLTKNELELSSLLQGQVMSTDCHVQLQKEPAPNPSLFCQHLCSSSSLGQWGSLAVAPCAFSWAWSSVPAELLEAHRQLLGSSSWARGTEAQPSRAHWTPTPHTSHTAQHPQHTAHCTKNVTVWCATVLKYEESSRESPKCLQQQRTHSLLNLMWTKPA